MILLDIQRRREARGWSQSELARRSGVPQLAISRLERPAAIGGRRGVEFAVLEVLAENLGVRPGQLVQTRPNLTAAQIRVANAKRRSRRRGRDG